MINRKAYSEFLKQQIQFNKEQKLKEFEMDKILMQKVKAQNQKDEMIAKNSEIEKLSKTKTEFRRDNDEILRIKSMKANVILII